MKLGQNLSLAGQTRPFPVPCISYTIDTAESEQTWLETGINWLFNVNSWSYTDCSTTSVFVRRARPHLCWVCCCVQQRLTKQTQRDYSARGRAAKSSHSAQAESAVCWSTDGASLHLSHTHLVKIATQIFLYHLAQSKKWQNVAGRGSQYYCMCTQAFTDQSCLTVWSSSESLEGTACTGCGQGERRDCV